MFCDSQEVRSVRLAIYLRNSFLDDAGYYFKSIDVVEGYSGKHPFPLMPGARIAVHSRDVKPSMKLETTVSPGMATAMFVSSTKRQRLPPPYGNCVGKTYLDTEQQIRYSIPACISLCGQREVQCVVL